MSVLEQTSARVLTPAQIDRPCNWVVCDASFIGLAKVLETPLALAAPDCRLVALIKPQFEVGREEVGKGGVVRDPALHARVCDEVRAMARKRAAGRSTASSRARSPGPRATSNSSFRRAARCCSHVAACARANIGVDSRRILPMNRLASPAQLRASFLRWALFMVPVVLLLGLLSGKLARQHGRQSVVRRAGQAGDLPATADISRSSGPRSTR